MALQPSKVDLYDTKFLRHKFFFIFPQNPALRNQVELSFPIEKKRL